MENPSANQQIHLKMSKIKLLVEKTSQGQLRDVQK